MEGNTSQKLNSLLVNKKASAGEKIWLAMKFRISTKMAIFFMLITYFG